MTSRNRQQCRLRVETWSFGRIVDAVDGALEGAHDARPTGVSSDTRTIDDGELFFALRGERFDAHDFLPEAAASGAGGAVVRSGYRRPEDVPDAFPLIRVEEPRSALANLGRGLWREAREEGLHTIDVTGSNGKTTTKELLSAIWSTEGDVYATPGNCNNDVGLPLTLCGLPESCDHLVLEMAANNPGELDQLVRLAPGDERLVTSIGRDHLEGFGSIEGVRRSKSEVFACSDETDLAVVPAAERDRLELDSFAGTIWTFGAEQSADLRMTDYRPVEPESGRFAFQFRTDRDCWTLELGVPGRHNGANLACALSTIAGRGDVPDLEAVQSRLDDVELPGGRWRVSRVEDLEFVDDAYNANPTSVRASFSAFLDAVPRHLGGEVPRIAVLGDMLELGDNADALHREVAAELAGSDELDGLCVVGEFAGEMARGVETADRRDLEVCVCDDAGDVADRLERWRPAFVWLKASRVNELERVVALVRDRYGGE